MSRTQFESPPVRDECCVASRPRLTISPVRAIATISCAAAFLVCAATPLAQDQPLERRFSAGAASEYRIQLKVTSRVEGQETATIGANAYVKPFAREASATISWTAQVRVASFSADSASIEEALDAFETQTPSAPAMDDDPETARLEQALQTALVKWETPQTLEYHESRAGQTTDISAAGAPELGEQTPRVLTAWLLRALRPEVSLPARPLRLDDHWQEPRTVTLPDWSNASGSESGQWFAAPNSQSKARLDIVQQIDASVASGPEKPPEGAAVAEFHSESLSTISLDDGSLLAATRSATREISWTLAPVSGLPASPKFGSRLTVEIQIVSCDENPCSTLHSALRRGAPGAN
jgi:hypothetical protein